MFNISTLLHRIKNLQEKETSKKNIISEAIDKFVGIKIPIEYIAIKSGVITLKNISQTARSEVFVKKQFILDEVNKNQKIIIVIDIR